MGVAASAFIQAKVNPLRCGLGHTALVGLRPEVAVAQGNPEYLSDLCEPEV